MSEEMMELSEEIINWAGMTLVDEEAEEFFSWADKAKKLEADLKERTDQYHLAHAKILSREAINEDLANDYNQLEAIIKCINAEQARYIGERRHKAGLKYADELLTYADALEAIN